MIAKLLKYQFRELARTFIPASLIPFAVILLLSFMGFIPNPILIGLVASFSWLVLGGQAILLQILAVVNDYGNMQGKRAYFLRGIPATTGSLFSARLIYYICTNLWSILFVLAEMAIIFCLTLRKLTLAQVAAGEIPVGFWLFMVLISIVGSVFSAFISMAVVSLGSQSGLHRFGIGGPILVYVILYLAQQVGNLLFMFFIPLGVKLGTTATGGAKVELLTESMFNYYRSNLFSTVGTTGDPFIGLGFIFFYLILGVVLASLTYRSMKYKTSLD